MKILPSQQPDGLALADVPNLATAAAAGFLVHPGCLTIGLMSDLHTESGLGPDEVPCPDVDVWIAAGDIATQKSPLSSIQWLVEFSALAVKKNHRVAPILFVPGNHDFYRGVVSAARARWKKEAKGTSVHVMDNDELVLAGVRFLGTSLWSNFSGVGPLLRPHMARSAEQNIADFFVIESAPFVRWTTADLVREHDQSYRFLADRLGVPYAEDGVSGREFINEDSARFRDTYQREMALGGHDVFDATLRVPGDQPRASAGRAFPVGMAHTQAAASSCCRARNVDHDGLSVVLTHWAPHLKANHPMFVGGDLSSYFVNHHPELCRAANLWLFGHTHTLSDFVVDDGPEDRAQVEQALVIQRDAWRAKNGMDGPLRDDPLFDPLPVRAAACWGRVISHPRGYPKEHVPGLGPAPYAPLVLSLFPDGHAERHDGR